MDICLADVLVNAVVCDKANLIPGAVALRIDCGIVIGDAREQDVARLIFVFFGNGRVGQGGLKDRAILARSLQGILQIYSYCGRGGVDRHRRLRLRVRKRTNEDDSGGTDTKPTKQNGLTAHSTYLVRL